MSLRPSYFFGSVGYPAFSHSLQPPLRTFTFPYPASMNLRATLALVPSLGQAQ